MPFSRDKRSLTIADTIGVATLNAVAPSSKKVTSTPRLEELGLSPHLTASTLPRRLRSTGTRATTRFKLLFISKASYLEAGDSAHRNLECAHKGSRNAEGCHSDDFTRGQSARLWLPGPKVESGRARNSKGCLLQRWQKLQRESPFLAKVGSLRTSSRRQSNSPPVRHHR